MLFDCTFFALSFPSVLVFESLSNEQRRKKSQSRVFSFRFVFFFFLFAHEKKETTAASLRLLSWTCCCCCCRGEWKFVPIPERHLNFNTKCSTDHKEGNFLVIKWLMKIVGTVLQIKSPLYSTEEPCSNSIIKWKKCVTVAYNRQNAVLPTYLCDPWNTSSFASYQIWVHIYWYSE